MDRGGAESPERRANGNIQSGVQVGDGVKMLVLLWNEG